MLVIDSCPEKYNVSKKTKELCTSSKEYFTNIPVSLNSTAYRNIYCARCNGLSLADIEIWHPTYLCRQNFNVTKIEAETAGKLHDQCHNHYIKIPPKFLLRPQCEKMKSCRSPLKTRITKACHSYSAPVSYRYELVKNVHCALCMNIRLESLSCKNYIRKPTPTVPVFNVYPFKFPNLDILFDFIDVLDERSNGDKGEDEHPHASDAENVESSPGKPLSILKGNAIAQNPTETVSINAIFLHNDNVSLILDENWRNKLTKSLQLEIQNITNMTTMVHVNDSCPVQISFQEQIVKNYSFNHNNTCILFEFGIFFPLRKDYTRIVYALKNVVKSYFGSITAFSKSHVFMKNFNQITDGWTCLLRTNTVKKTKVLNCNNNFSLWSAEIDSSLGLNSETHFVFDFSFGKNKSDNKVYTESTILWYTLCKNEPERCSKVYFNKENFSVINNNTIVLHQYNKVLDRSSYRRVGDGIVTCFEHLSDKPMTKPTARILLMLKGITSLVCTCLSLFSLMVTFITYCVFSRLRNLPGKCVMCLVVALFLAQFTFEIGNLPGHIPLLCLITSLVQHYSWLASFAWMNVLSFNVWKSFTTLKNIESKSERNRDFVRYSLYAWLSPMVFIIPCTVLHFIDSFEIGYMTTGYCWLMRGRSVIYFFAVPVALVMMFNLGMFVTSAVAIHKSLKSSQLVRETGLTRELWVLVRVATLMGITWVFGFAAWIHDILAFIFIILNGSQGFLIFILFVPQNIVKNITKSKFNRTLTINTMSRETTIPTISEITL